MHRPLVIALLVLAGPACARPSPTTATPTIEAAAPPPAPAVHERGGRAWAYALMVRAPEPELERMIPLPAELARALLVRYGALPEAAG